MFEIISFKKPKVNDFKVTWIKEQLMKNVCGHPRVLDFKALENYDEV